MLQPAGAPPVRNASHGSVTRYASAHAGLLHRLPARPSTASSIATSAHTRPAVNRRIPATVLSSTKSSALPAPVAASTPLSATGTVLSNFDAVGSLDSAVT